MIGILAVKTRSLLGTMDVPSKYWPLAMITAAYLLNRTPSAALMGRTPLEVSAGEKPDLMKMKVFGCKAFVQIPKPQRRSKLNPMAWQGMMVGYSTNSPEWITLDSRTNNLRKAYSVVFLEDVKGVLQQAKGRIKEIELNGSIPHGINVYDNGRNDDGDGTYGNGAPKSDEDVDQEPKGADIDDQPSEQLNETTEENEPPTSADYQVAEDQLLSLGLCMAMTMTEELPITWKQAVNVSHWKEAMEKEIKELQGKGAWVLVDRTDDMKVLPGVWNYRDKRDENGNIAKYKARWCVNGSGDKFKWPPETTYSPGAEISTVRLAFAAAAATGQEVLQADFPNAYLNADMTENVYICQPYGIYNGEDRKKVCLLKKALYGCPISGKRWHDEIASKIKTLGYS